MGFYALTDEQKAEMRRRHQRELDERLEREEAATRRLVAERDAAHREAQERWERVAAAVRVDYPRLCEWSLPCPEPQATDERGYTLRAETEAYREYLERVVYVAASRISEAYGLGAGEEWMARHGLDAARDVDARARRQTQRSLHSALA